MIKKSKNVRNNWDLFISYASEDKEEIAWSLVQTLESYGLSVWFGESEIKVGDSITDKIEYGLAKSNFGILILSYNFIKKKWPKREWNALLNKELHKKNNVILPIRHNISQEVINRRFPLLSDRHSLDSQKGIVPIAEKIVEKIKGRTYLEKVLRSKEKTFDTKSFAADMSALLKQGKIAAFNKKRYTSPKISLDLHDNDFSYTKLNGADLSEVNLIDANLKEANLEYTNLFGASLMRADLRRTNLHYAILKYANLEKAKLQYSNLEYAYLDRAYLQYADLTNASLKYASIECADLRYADINGTIFLENFRLPITKDEARSRGAIIGRM